MVLGVSMKLMLKLMLSGLSHLNFVENTLNGLVKFNILLE